ncbi:MAG: helix-turn-helix transcriptional regulator [Candidatus Omnitrophota bacterium]|nr:helix-turn-helix transcriptional regulator [Candidatus Omnitrophota bacterium]
MQKSIFLKPNDIIPPDLTGRYYMEVGARIKKIRKEMKLTQDELASKLNIHSKQLARYEAGRSIPILGIIARIANFCEVSTDYLIFGEDKKLAKKTKIADMELVEYFRRINKLKKFERDKIKWAIKSLLNGESE